MKKDMKKVYSYGIVMIAAVLIIVLVACLSESRLDSAQEQYENMMTKQQEKVGELEGEITQLKESLALNMDIQAKLDKHNQIMSDLTEIYNLTEEGRKDEAAEKFGNIETGGFDDGELAFYNLIKRLLK